MAFTVVLDTVTDTQNTRDKTGSFKDFRRDWVS